MTLTLWRSAHLHQHLMNSLPAWGNKIGQQAASGKLSIWLSLPSGQALEHSLQLSWQLFASTFLQTPLKGLCVRQRHRIHGMQLKWCHEHCNAKQLCSLPKIHYQVCLTAHCSWSRWWFLIAKAKCGTVAWPRYQQSWSCTCGWNNCVYASAVRKHGTMLQN